MLLWMDGENIEICYSKKATDIIAGSLFSLKGVKIPPNFPLLRIVILAAFILEISIFSQFLSQIFVGITLKYHLITPPVQMDFGWSLLHG